MKIRIILDVDTANAALAALAMQAATLARMTKDRDPILTPDEWLKHLRAANDQTVEMRKAIGNAELVTLG